MVTGCKYCYMFGTFKFVGGLITLIYFKMLSFILESLQYGNFSISMPN